MAIIGGERVHSNIHVGELHWGTNPHDETDWPDWSPSIEIDHHAGAPNVAHPNTEWSAADLERNLRPYRPDATFVRDDTIAAEPPGPSSYKVAVR